MNGKETEASRTVNIISRVLAVLLLFIALPSYLGLLLDRQFGTAWIMPLLVVVGTVAGLGALLLVVKKMELDEPKGPKPKYRSPEELDEEESKWRQTAEQDSDPKEGSNRS